MTQMSGATGSPTKIRDRALPITPPQPQMKSTQTVIEACALKIGGFFGNFSFLVLVKAEDS